MKALGHETALLKGLAENDSAAIERIYKENYGVVQAFILQNNGGTGVALHVFFGGVGVVVKKKKKRHILGPPPTKKKMN